MSETPGTLVLQTELASTKKAIGDLRHDTGQSQKASESYQRSLDLLEPLAHAPPENLRLQWHLAAVYDSLARHERHPKWCDKRSHNWLRMTPNSTYRRQRLQQAEAQ